MNNHYFERYLMSNMRKLWEDHIIWTRMYIVSLFDNLEDIEQITNRLMTNQEDIGNIIRPYYGDKIGNKLTQLLKDHISTAAQFLKETKERNIEASSETKKKWYENADEIALLLSDINPNWPKQIVKFMFYDHLDFTESEAIARFHKDYVADINAFDNVHAHAIEMAEVLTDGIIRQFPGKFSK